MLDRDELSVSVVGYVHVIQLYALVQVYEISINVCLAPAASFSQLGAMVLIPQITPVPFLLNSCSPVSGFTSTKETLSLLCSAQL
jgi:hypothetical protein